MDDRGLAAAIVSGEPDGLAEALDRYGTSLLASCRAALPATVFGADAAGEVVLDTFLIARSRLGALADPGKLDAWLQAVARNECLRRARDAGLPPPAAAAGNEAASFPPRLRGRIMAACADDTPTGRATLATVSHRAGPFGRDGFPKPPPARRGRRPSGRTSVTIAAIGAAVVAAVIVAALGLHRGSPPKPAAADLATGGAASAAGPAPASDAPASAPQAPRTGQHRAGPPSPRASATLQAATSPGQPSATDSATAPTAPRSPAPPKPSTSPQPPPPGALVASTQFVSLTSVNNKPVSYTLVLTAQGGPVTGYSLYVPSGSVTIQPTYGSLPADGSVMITVTAHAKSTFTTTITVSPGGLSIELHVIAKL